MSEPVVAKLAFEDAPCECVRQHNPRPATVEMHHLWPQYDQIKKHGKVVDKEVVSLCGTAHNNVHAAIDAWLKNKSFMLGNRHQRAIAHRGYNKIMEVRNG